MSCDTPNFYQQNVFVFTSPSLTPHSNDVDLSKGRPIVKHHCGEWRGGGREEKEEPFAKECHFIDILAQGVLAKIVAEFKLSLLFSCLCKPGFLKLCFSLPVRCLVSKLHVRRRFARMLWIWNYLTTKKLESVSAIEKCIPFKVGSQMLEYCRIRTLENLTCSKTKPVMNLSLQYLSIETWGSWLGSKKKKLCNSLTSSVRTLSSSWR